MTVPGTDGGDWTASTDRAGLVAGSVVAVLLLVTLASGPILADVSFTSKQVTAEDAAPGNATVSNVSFPSTVTFTYTGEREYEYDAKPVRVSFERITGGDVQLTYVLLVPELQLTHGRTTITDGTDRTGETDLTIQLRQNAEGAPPEVTQYRGTVYLSMISEGEDRLVARSNVTVKVGRSNDTTEIISDA